MPTRPDPEGNGVGNEAMVGGAAATARTATCLPASLPTSSPAHKALSKTLALEPGAS